VNAFFLSFSYLIHDAMEPTTKAIAIVAIMIMPIANVLWCFMSTNL